MTEVERQVVADMLSNRFKDFDSKLHRLEGDRYLGDVALVVGGEHLPILARQL
jgi:hypothetical protein